MDKKWFKLTEDHIKLLRKAYIGWNDCEFGAPEIDPKRPYGNSSVIHDIAGIIGVEPYLNAGDQPDYTSRQKEWMENIHKETRTALQIILQTGEMKPGIYEADKYSHKWTLVADKYGEIP